MILEAESDIEVVGEAADGREAVEEARRLRPDVVLMDVRMPDVDGIEATRRLLGGEGPDTKVVMLTVSEADSDLFAALRAGADGYLLKTMNLGRLAHALRGVLNGQAPIHRALVSRILERIQTHEPRRRQLVPSDELASRLTSREWEVLELLAQGRSTSEIARELVLSKSAVRVHIASLVKKLAVADRSAAAALFRERSET
jgi:DNA-binding NarL/FixJ family response regulator